MRTILILIVIGLFGCTKEPTCITCHVQGQGYWSGCIEEYNVESVEELHEAVKPILGDGAECEYH